jgi:hypothetical protein
VTSVFNVFLYSQKYGTIYIAAKSQESEVLSIIRYRGTSKIAGNKCNHYKDLPLPLPQVWGEGGRGV